MVVWVVKMYDYQKDITDVYGVYSNLALAGRAIIKSFENSDATLTFTYSEKPWGYEFRVKEIENFYVWDYQEIEIGRMIINV